MSKQPFVNNDSNTVLARLLPYKIIYVSKIELTIRPRALATHVIRRSQANPDVVILSLLANNYYVMKGLLHPFGSARHFSGARVLELSLGKLITIITESMCKLVDISVKQLALSN